jgi:hypothetical protein
MASGISNCHGGITRDDARAPELYSITGRPYAATGAVGGGDLAFFTRSGHLEWTYISTLGNTQDFGNAGGLSSSGSAVSSSTRAVIYNGDVAQGNYIFKFEFSTKGNASDFGDVTVNRANLGGFCSDTRGCFGGGEAPGYSDVVDYITIATIGNAADFGNLTGGMGNTGACGNHTRGIIAGGYDDAYSDNMDYFTIASTGNATDFGNLVEALALPSDGCGSSTTRGIFSGGSDGNPYRNHIQYITFASTGNTTDFGDLTENKQSHGAAGNGTRGLHAGGYIHPANSAAIDYITIASTGDAADFGDLTAIAQSINGASNCHGALA